VWILAMLNSPVFPLEPLKITVGVDLILDVSARGYTMNDQRIAWSGLEFTFGAEARVAALLRRQFRGGHVGVEAEFFINQPFGRNILTDEVRQDYLANWEVETFGLSKLNVVMRAGNFTARIGKAETPFGRTYFPVYSNDLTFGSPFIRSEAILWRETGIFLSYHTAGFSFDLAGVNGETDRDTNSGKSGIARLGYRSKYFAAGVSYKIHDGIGSEQQKIYKNHLGADLAIFLSHFTLSAEYIEDEYGFHREFAEEDIFWPRSLYYRDIFYEYKTPIEGRGWYVNLLYQNESVMVNLNYGEYYPQKIGHPFHDPDIRRGILKISVNVLKEVRLYLVGLIENKRPLEEWQVPTSDPYAFLAGVEFQL
jgi:hypothetical protein